MGGTLGFVGGTVAPFEQAGLRNSRAKGEARKKNGFAIAHSSRNRGIGGKPPTHREMALEAVKQGIS